MPETKLDSARQKTEVLRHLVVDQPLVEFNDKEISIGFSAGVAAWKNGESLAALIERADSALYKAKKGGRDRTLVEGE